MPVASLFVVSLLLGSVTADGSYGSFTDGASFVLEAAPVEIVGGAGSLPPQPVAVLEAAPVEIVGGAGSFGGMGSFGGAIQFDAGINFDFSSVTCGNAFDLAGDDALPLPWADFGNCELTAGLNLCDDDSVLPDGATTVKGQMARGCRFACGLAPACPGSAAVVAAAEECNYNVHISSAAWADEIHWAVENSMGDEVHYSDPGAYGENQEYDEAIQLSPGQHTFVAYDVYGDGWNGGTFGVSNADTGTVVVATTVFDYGFEISTAFDTPGCGSVEPPTEPTGHSHDDHSRVEDTTPTGPVTIQLLIHSADWSNEMSWNIDGSDSEISSMMRGGNTVDSLTGPYENYDDYPIMLTLTAGTHTLNIFDEYGDGWNDGGGFAISADGVDIIPEVVFDGGFEKSFDFEVGVPPPNNALPVCMQDCEHQPADGTQVALCKFTGEYDFTEACFSDCDMTSESIILLLEECAAMHDVFENIMDPSVDPNAYGSIFTSGSMGDLSSFIATVADEGSFTVDPMDNLAAGVLVQFSPEEITAPDFLEPDFGEATAEVPTQDPTAPPTQDPTAPPTQDPTSPPFQDPTSPPTQMPTAEWSSGYGAGSGSGSGAATAATAATAVTPFDDDFITQEMVSTGLLMKGEEEQKVQARHDTTVEATAAVVGLCMGAAMVVTAMRRRAHTATQDVEGATPQPTSAESV